MAALSKKMPDHEPSDIELLLPWHAAGALDARDARRVQEALARDPELARQYAVIREEYAETIALNESMGAPSIRAMQRLFAAIDAEPERRPSAARGLSMRISSFFARLSPGTLGAAPPRALVRFAPEANVAEMTALLEKYQASIIGSARGGMFRLQFGDQAMSKDDLNSLIDKLSHERIVSRAVPAQ
jgi:anti-sigma factor RsiW